MINKFPFTSVPRASGGRGVTSPPRTEPAGTPPTISTASTRPAEAPGPLAQTRPPVRSCKGASEGQTRSFLASSPCYREVGPYLTHPKCLLAYPHPHPSHAATFPVLLVTQECPVIPTPSTPTAAGASHSPSLASKSLQLPPSQLPLNPPLSHLTAQGGG